MKRPRMHKSIWADVTEVFGTLCFYCQQEPAQSIDHVIPANHGGTNDRENLRPCCMWCNQHANDRLFDSVEEKQEFLIQKRRSNRRLGMQTICTSCLLPFQRPHMTNSMFECPICDPEKCREAQLAQWSKFLDVLQDAGYKFSIHKTIREMSNRGVRLKTLRNALGEAYTLLAIAK